MIIWSYSLSAWRTSSSSPALSHSSPYSTWTRTILQQFTFRLLHSSHTLCLLWSCGSKWPGYTFWVPSMFPGNAAIMHQMMWQTHPQTDFQFWTPLHKCPLLLYEAYDSMINAFWCFCAAVMQYLGKLSLQCIIIQTLQSSNLWWKWVMWLQT